MSNPKDRPSDSELDAWRKLQQRAVDIAAGDVYPNYYDRLAGQPPYRENVRLDLRNLATLELDSGRHSDEADAALRHLADHPSRWSAQAARDAIKEGFENAELRFSLDWLSGLLGDRDAACRVAAELLTTHARSVVQRGRQVITAYAFAVRAETADQREAEYEAGHLTRLLDSGELSHTFAVEARRRLSAIAEWHPPQADPEPVEDLDLSAADVLREIGEHQKPVPGPKSLLPKPKGDGMIVVPRLPEGGTSWRKEIARSWIGKAGVALPLVERGDVAEHARVLKARWPHAASIIDTILGDLAAREAVRIRPTLLVGKPGSGKSSLATAIAVQIGLPHDLVPLGGAADSSVMGTSAQYASARESAVLQLAKRSGVANPLMIWDEVEKASPSRHNGSPLDALLAMLEPDQARAYRDPALEVPCDLSMVSHLATANDLEKVPAPLRDRMRVLTMPEPTWQHLPTLVRGIVEDLAKQRGLDARWYPPLAEDEMHVVRQAWPGGSVRQLQRIVQVMVDGRDKTWGRA